MTDSVLTEVNCRPLKIPKLDKACEGSKSSPKQRELKLGDVEDDEYLRQYLLFHYQFQKSESFGSPQYSTKQSNQEVINEVTLRAIATYNQDNVSVCGNKPSVFLACLNRWIGQRPEITQELHCGFFSVEKS